MECFHNLIYLIGGIIKYLHDLFLVLSPFVNSYKIFKKFSFAPNLVDTRGYQSKDPTIRVIGKDNDLHIEIRIGAADCNPCIVFTASIGMAMEDVKNKILPPEIVIGDIFIFKEKATARKNLLESIRLFEKSEFSKKIHGCDFAEFKANFFHNELNLYKDHMSILEINIYLDLV